MYEFGDAMPIVTEMRIIKPLEPFSFAGRQFNAYLAEHILGQVTVLKYLFDVIHKLTTYLAKNFKKIAIEDLNVKGMLKNHKLAKYIADSSFAEFRRQLSYKAEMYGSEIVIADRFYPSTKMCGKCSAMHEMPLGKRIFECECGFKADRDLNAALNLEKLCTVSCTGT